MDDAPPCAGGCGFYGSATTKDLCSKCYKLYLQKLNEEATKNHAIPQTGSDGTVWDDLKAERFRLPRIKVTVDHLSPDSKNRCSWCDKKVGLLGFRCRCGGSFCGKHRYPEVNGVEGHLCFYDYKTVGRAALEKENPIVIADKLPNRV